MNVKQRIRLYCVFVNAVVKNVDTGVDWERQKMENHFEKPLSGPTCQKTKKFVHHASFTSSLFIYFYLIYLFNLCEKLLFISNIVSSFFLMNKKGIGGVLTPPSQWSLDELTNCTEPDPNSSQLVNLKSWK